MKRIVLLSASLLLNLICTVGKGLDAAFKLIPQPQSVEVFSDTGVSFSDIGYITISWGARMPVLGELLGRLPHTRTSGVGVSLELTDSDVPASTEGYVLQVGNEGVAIKARDEAGLFYGCQTLEQLMADSRDFGLTIPRMKIVDYPAISYRAVHLDTKHHLDRMEYYYRMVDKLASYKVNAIIWELEDKLRYTRRPEVAAPNAISKQEMQALCRYAQERNVEISPLVQGLGHAGYILKHHSELRENPKSDWEFCPSDERTYDLLFDLYQDAIEAMPYGKYLHIGGDEITAIGIDDRCRNTGRSALELQMGWLRKVCRYATEHGRTSIFWDDMPLKYADVWQLLSTEMSDEELSKAWNTDKLDKAMALFPKDCVYMRWQYGDATKNTHKRLLRWYHDSGLKVMGATAASAGDSPLMPRDNSRVEYIRGFNQLVADNSLEGILSTAWDDGSPHLETVWRGFIAQGEYGWNPYARSVEEFKAAHAQREYGFREKEHLMAFLDELEQAVSFYDGALVSSGHRNPVWGVTDFTLIDLPDGVNAGAWCAKYKDRIARATLEEERYWRIRSAIATAKNKALRNRYTLDVYEQVNELQHFPTRLLLSLRLFDLAKGTQLRRKRITNAMSVSMSFDTIRTKLENVYSKTRFLCQPDGYVTDMNHHNHLAAKTENNDWMFLYELPMVEKVMMWAKEMENKF